MIELFQFEWSPYCIVQRRILEFSGIQFQIVDVPNTDRSLIWRITKQRYYQVPVVRDGRNVIFETEDNSQVVAKYLDDKLQLGLFPREWEGVQSLVWRHIENEIEGAGFKLNDVYWEEFVPARERMAFLRHKERKFGRGCISRWRESQKELKEELTSQLLPYEEMLSYRKFLLGDQPRFLDFDLFGMLGNFLYSGHYSLPAAHTQLKAWYGRMNSIKLPSSAREKLHS